MYASFKYESIQLKDIDLDLSNPRIVTQKKLSSQAEVLQYLYEYEDLERFIKKIAGEGKNVGAERPYVVKSGSVYIVVEGNTRVAAYKILTGLISPPKEYAASVPQISAKLKKHLTSVDCSVAPNRATLLPIMASAHFGLGDKSKWGYLGSRKAVFDEWQSGKTIPQLAKAFARTSSQIQELILEYRLYLESLKLHWTAAEQGILQNPKVEFNPPVRFLQTSGHKAKVGIKYDMSDLSIKFDTPEAKKKFKHLISRLVINPSRGMGATATYDEVFADYGSTKSGKAGAAAAPGKASSNSAPTAAQSSGSSGSATVSGTAPGQSKVLKAAVDSLFAYKVNVSNGLLDQLMHEARTLNCKKFPAAGTFLLRNVLEAILKHIIEDQKAHTSGGHLDLEGSINLCVSNNVKLSKEDKKILSQFKKDYLDYLNLGAHGNVIPNITSLYAARDSIEVFVKRNI
jgi:hypothetical protein